MTKTELERAVADAGVEEKRTAAAVLDALEEVVTKSVRKGEAVTIRPGFIKVSRKDVKARKAARRHESVHRRADDVQGPSGIEDRQAHGAEEAQGWRRHEALTGSTPALVSVGAAQGFFARFRQAVHVRPDSVAGEPAGSAFDVAAIGEPLEGGARHASASCWISAGESDCCQRPGRVTLVGEAGCPGSEGSHLRRRRGRPWWGRAAATASSCCCRSASRPTPRRAPDSITHATTSRVNFAPARMSSLWVSSCRQRRGWRGRCHGGFAGMRFSVHAQSLAQSGIYLQI